jgi:hypothetical protein
MLDAESKLTGNPPEQPESAVSGHSPADNETPVRQNGELGSVAVELSGTRKVPGRKATGPRTEMGKRKSSSNATKHAIFSKVILLKGESQSKYERLLDELHKALKPVGALEELLVEKLVSIIWRERRIDVSENAEILKRREFFEWDQQNRTEDQQNRRGDFLLPNLKEILNPPSLAALIQRINNEDVLKACLRMLSQLKQQIEEYGFKPEDDGKILEAIYGGRDPHLYREDLYDFYELWEYTAEASEEQREREGYSSPE